MNDIKDTLAGATPRQRAFIEDLLAQREYELGNAVIADAKQASALIDALLKAPRKAAGARKRDEEVHAALSAIQKSKYAIPASELALDFLDEKFENDLLFVEVSEWQGNLYLKRLHGSTGGFTRSRLSRKDVLALARLIAQDSYKYARLFGEHYACCGKCGAELTDETSRRLFLGPVCRQAWGF